MLLSTSVRNVLKIPKWRPPQGTHLHVVFALAALIVALLAPGEAMAANRVFKNTQATGITTRVISLSAGSHTFRTLNHSSGCDPFLHLLPWPNTTGEIGHDDDGAGNFDSLLTVNIATAGTYMLVARAYTLNASGTADIQQDGTTIATAVPVGGNNFNIAGGLNLIETALVAGGAYDTVIFGMTSGSALTFYDDDSGVGTASKAESTNTTRILVGAYNTSTQGPTNLYVNDYATDTDGDGLGDELEADLGTCVSAAACPSIFNPKDTDRDGLSDKVEIFGVDDANSPQFLPRWGANPRHKDIFLEMDYATSFASEPFTPADAAEAQTYFTAGKAGDLLNPDGVDGVSLHFDIANSSNPSSTLFGSWGGAGQSTGPLGNFTPIRVGLFRNGYMFAGGGGTTGTNNNWVNWGGTAANRQVPTFVHELGHSVGLEHWGHASWGGGNCKPGYPSIMSYSFPGAGFSQGLNLTVLSPAKVSEINSFPAPTIVPSSLTSTFGFPVSDRKVDWNLSGDYVDGASGFVRAAINWAPGSGCASFVMGTQWIQWAQPNFAAGDSPKLAKVNGRMYLFTISGAGTLQYYQGAVSGADASGSCPGGKDSCVAWSTLQTIPTNATPTNVSVVNFQGGILVVYRRSNGELWAKYSTSVTGAGNFQNWSVEQNVGTSTVAPELTVMYVNSAIYGVSELAATFGVNGGAYGMFTLSALGQNWVNRGSIANTAGTTMTGGVSPTVVSWPNRGGGNYSAFGTSCATFIDTNQDVRFYCYVKSTNRWQDWSSTMYANYPMDKSSVKTGLAFHVLRSDTGVPIGNDPTAGQFHLITVANIPQPRARISNKISQASPISASTKFMNVGYWWDQWQTPIANTNVMLFEDESISALKGAILYNQGAPNQALGFLPYADGTYDVAMKDGNDFRVMERGICWGVAPGDGTAKSAWCGTVNQWNY